MMLWPILALMTAVAIFAVCWPLLRQRNPARSGNDVAVYRDQLDEIGRDESSGLIGKAEAEAARVEVSRRLIVAAEAAKAASLAAPSSARSYRLATVVAAFALLPAGAGAAYLALGSPEFKPASMMSEEAAGRQDLPEGIEQTVAQVEAYLEKNPTNGKGWELLAPVYIRLGRFDEAVTARRKALEIFGSDASRLGDLGEAIVLASSGKVTPEAKDLFTRAEASDPKDVMAQYYLGLTAKQEGRRDEAEKRWNALVSSAPEGAEYLPLVKSALARIDQTDPQPSAPSAPADRTAAAAPQDHNGSSIDGMVERLAERLKKDGSDVQGWIQLVRSYSVLHKDDKVKAAVADARAALAKDPNGLKQFEDSVQDISGGAAPADNAASAAPSAAPATSTPPAASGAPSAAAAAADAPPSDHAASAAASDHDGMVERLAERMKKDGSDVQGWIKLVRSYRVLHKDDKAAAATADARAALAKDPNGLKQFEDGLVAKFDDAPADGAAGAAAANAPPPDHSLPTIDAMVERLAQRLKKDGSNVPGWIQLVRSYRTLGKADKAAAAADDARAALAGNKDALEQLEDGVRAALKIAPAPAEDAQGGGAAGADSAASKDTAASPTPAAPPIASAPPSGPNASDMAAAEKMAPAARNEMIEGMVSRLAQRLAENGSDVEGWLRLIRAYSVLGERDKALAAAANARTALSGNSDNLRRIGELTKELGLEGS